MINNLARDIELGPRQLSLFETEDDALAEQERLRAFVVDYIQQQGQTNLCEVVPKAAEALGWSEFKIMQQLFWLVQSFEILFKINNTVVPPRIARNSLTETPAPNVMIAPNEPVDEALLLSVKALYQKLWHNRDTVGGPSELACLITAAIRDWKHLLESYSRSHRPGFPGKKDIVAGLAFVKKLLVNQDIFSLFNAINENSEEIALLAKTVETLTFFYKHHKDRWQRMLDFTLESKDTLPHHIENQEIISSYQRFNQILSSAHPYKSLDEADGLFKALKIHYEKIVLHQTSQHRRNALSKVNDLIEKMKSHLKHHAAPADLCNQALYPLRVKSDQIKTAATISIIDRLMQEALESFETQWEKILDQTRWPSKW